MIEFYSESESRRAGLVVTPGIREGVLHDPKLYMVIEDRPHSEKPTILVMKLVSNDLYLPHRAEDSAGREFGETELTKRFFGSPIEDILSALGFTSNLAGATQ